FDVDVRLAEGLRVEQARFAARDGSLTLVFEPKGKDTTALTLTANNWTLPAGTPLMFEALSVQGALKGGELDLEQIEGVLYGGKISGSARAEWSRQWQLSGKAKLAGVDLVPVQKALGKPPRLSGRLRADAVFSSRAE